MSDNKRDVDVAIEAWATVFPDGSYSVHLRQLDATYACDDDACDVVRLVPEVTTGAEQMDESSRKLWTALDNLGAAIDEMPDRQPTPEQVAEAVREACAKVLLTKAVDLNDTNRLIDSDGTRDAVRTAYVRAFRSLDFALVLAGLKGGKP